MVMDTGCIYGAPGKILPWALTDSPLTSWMSMSSGSSHLLSEAGVTGTTTM